MVKKINSFREFWPHYVLAHSKPLTQWVHAIGTTCGVIWFVSCFALQQWLWLPLAPLWGYGPAWISHFFFEDNKPVTFAHPLYSFCADFKMLFLVYTGRMYAEVQKTQQQSLTVH